MCHVSACAWLVASILWIGIVRAAPVPEALVCTTRSGAYALVHKAMSEHFPAVFLFDMASGVVVDSGDEGDLAFERSRVGAFAEWYGVLRALSSKATGSPGRAAVSTAHTWTNVSADAATDALILWYENDADEGAPSECERLMADTEREERRWRLLPIVHALVMERLLYSQTPACADINQRLMFDPVTFRGQCVCQQDKMCGRAGSRNHILLFVIIAVACALVYITNGVALYTVVAKLREHATDSLAPPNTVNVRK